MATNYYPTRKKRDDESDELPSKKVCVSKAEYVLTHGTKVTVHEKTATAPPDIHQSMSSHMAPR